MAEFLFTSPGGKKYRVHGEGTAEDAFKALQAQIGQQQPQQPEEGFLHRDARRAQAALDAITNASTFHAGPKLQGLEDAVLGRGEGSFWERYEQGRQGYEKRLQQGRQEFPVAAIAGDIGGTVAGGAGLARQGATLLRGAMRPAQAFVRGGLEGAAYGGAHAAGGAQPGEVLPEAAKGAAIGAALGGPLSAGGQALANALGRRAAASAAPSVDDLYRQGSAAYSQIRAQGPVFQGFRSFANQARQALHQSGFRARVHPRIAAALSEIDDAAKQGALDFDDIQSLRQMLNGVGAPGDAENRLAKILRDGLDTYVEQSGVPGAREARSIWSRYKKGQQIEGAVQAARDRAGSSYSGGNVENAIRQEIRKILGSPRKVAGYSQAERDLMRQVVGTDEGAARQALRTLAKLSPQGSGLMAMLSGAGGAGLAGMTGNPLFLAPAAVGFGSKIASDAMTRSAANTLAAAVRGGQALPRASKSLVGPALVRALAAEAGKKNGNVLRAGGKVARGTGADDLVRALIGQ